MEIRIYPVNPLTPIRLAFSLVNSRRLVILVQTKSIYIIKAGGQIFYLTPMPIILDCPNIKTNKEQCPCPSKDCANNGFCCQCVAKHRKQGDLPICLRGKR